MSALDISVRYAIKFTQVLARKHIETFVSGIEERVSIRFRSMKSNAPKFVLETQDPEFEWRSTMNGVNQSLVKVIPCLIVLSSILILGVACMQNNESESFTTTETGLQYKDISVGSGELAGEGVLATEDDVSRACIDASTVSIDASLEVHSAGE